MLDGGATIPCVLWDISDGGARVAAARVNSLPETFGLFLTKDGSSRRFCRVAWRKDGQLGIRFIEEAAANIDLDPKPAYMRRRATPIPVSAPKAARPVKVSTSELVLPGCGPHAGPHLAPDLEPRPIAVSSIALGMLALLAAATALFLLTGIRGDERWVLEVCSRAGGFCQHPEWTGAASILMAVVYLAVRGMER